MLNNFNRGVFMTKTKDTSKAGKAKKIKVVQPSRVKGTAASSAKKASAKKPVPVKLKTLPKQKQTAAAPKALAKRPAAGAAVLQAAKKTKAKLSPRDQRLHQIKLMLLRQRAALLDKLNQLSQPIHAHPTADIITLVKRAEVRRELRLFVWHGIRTVLRNPVHMRL